MVRLVRRGKTWEIGSGDSEKRVSRGKSAYQVSCRRVEEEGTDSGSGVWFWGMGVSGYWDDDGFRVERLKGRGRLECSNDID